jgi:Flp pilus assembly protein TadB
LCCVFVVFVFVLFLVYSGVQHILCNKKQDEDKYNKNTTQYVLDNTIYKKQEEDKYNKNTTQYVLDTTIYKKQDKYNKNTTQYVLDTTVVFVFFFFLVYCVVLHILCCVFVVFVFVLFLVYSGVQHILCCVFCCICLVSCI